MDSNSASHVEIACVPAKVPKRISYRILRLPEPHSNGGARLGCTLSEGVAGSVLRNPILWNSAHPPRLPTVRERIRKIRNEYGNRTVLLGGPPCQSYSVAGRVRNAVKADYNADEDEASVSIFAVCKSTWTTSASRGRHGKREGNDFRSPRRQTDFSSRLGPSAPRGQCKSLPTVCLVFTTSNPEMEARSPAKGFSCARRRTWRAAVTASGLRYLHPNRYCPRPSRARPAKPYIEASLTISVHDVIGAMPALRSRLSRKDHDASWRHAIREACEIAWEFRPAMEQDQEEYFLSSDQTGERVDTRPHSTHS